VVRLAANLSTMFRELPLLERFEQAARFGFRAVELQFPYEVRPAEIALALRARSLELVLMNAPAGDLDAGERGLVLEGGRRFKEAISLACEYAREAACPRIHVLIGKQQGGLRDKLRQGAVARLRWAASELANHGIDLMLEALNPHDQPGYALPSLESAEALRSQIGMANVRLLFDAYHVARGGRDPLQLLSTFLSVSGHIQISSAPDRCEPNAPEMHAFLEALDTQGYKGFVGCEYHPRGDTVAGLGWAARYGIGLKSDELVAAR
jgi:hydroxypyruvate isomerase